MESELDGFNRNETTLECLCIWHESGFAGNVLRKLNKKTLSVDPSYQRKTTTKPTKDRIKEVFEEWLWNESGYTKDEIEFGKMFNGYEGRARTFYAGYMAALKDRWEG